MKFIPRLLDSILLIGKSVGADHGVDLLVQFALHLLMVGHLQEENIQRRRRVARAGDEEVDQRHKQVVV